jgi:hypothetical protein
LTTAPGQTRDPCSVTVLLARAEWADAAWVASSVGRHSQPLPPVRQFASICQEIVHAVYRGTCKRVICSTGATANCGQEIGKFRGTSDGTDFELFYLIFGCNMETIRSVELDGRWTAVRSSVDAE